LTFRKKPITIHLLNRLNQTIWDGKSYKNLINMRWKPLLCVSTEMIRLS